MRAAKVNTLTQRKQRQEPTRNPIGQVIALPFHFVGTVIGAIGDAFIGDAQGIESKYWEPTTGSHAQRDRHQSRTRDTARTGGTKVARMWETPYDELPAVPREHEPVIKALLAGIHVKMAAESPVAVIAFLDTVVLQQGADNFRARAALNTALSQNIPAPAMWDSVQAGRRQAKQSGDIEAIDTAELSFIELRYLQLFYTPAKVSKRQIRDRLRAIERDLRPLIIRLEQMHDSQRRQASARLMTASVQMRDERQTEAFSQQAKASQLVAGLFDDQKLVDLTRSLDTSGATSGTERTPATAPDKVGSRIS